MPEPWHVPRIAIIASDDNCGLALAKSSSRRVLPTLAFRANGSNRPGIEMEMRLVGCIASQF